MRVDSEVRTYFTVNQSGQVSFYVTVVGPDGQVEFWDDGAYSPGNGCSYAPPSVQAVVAGALRRAVALALIALR